ncbi:hypothetical protein [Chryseobacterium taichungense]|uniref:hypothetical protein n=1 Tax=Chryseobacterium taichungense TaxID=295069 RepID=UPI0028A82BBA|nr:hypothetical protein [Chryseobacterium taichungense]
MKNNTLNKLKSDYEELEKMPSSDLWNRLEIRLAEESGKVVEKPFQWWKYAAVILLFVSLGSIFYFNSLKNEFNYKNTDYAVKKVLNQTINPINPEFQNQTDTSQANAENLKIATENQKKSSDATPVSKDENKITIAKLSDIKTQKVEITPDEKITIIPPKIESHTPVIAEVKKVKPSYINSNELLLGREFDKTTENPYKKDIKIGIFNFDKPRPNVENVTVLGVTVYVDSK